MTGLAGVWSARGPGAGQQNLQGSAACPSPSAHPRGASFPQVPWPPPVLADTAFWEGRWCLPYIFSSFLHSPKAQRQVGKACFVFTPPPPLRFPVCAPHPFPHPGSCSLGTLVNE